jgi:hypothetical protein
MSSVKRILFYVLVILWWTVDSVRGEGKAERCTPVLVVEGEMLTVFL